MEREDNDISLYFEVPMASELSALYDSKADLDELELTNLVALILYETEFDYPFNIPHVDVFTDDVVEEKYLSIENHRIHNSIPKGLTRDYPIQFDSETLKKAPWVNMVHAWGLVLNEMNTISEMQREWDTQKLPLVIAAVGNTLYKFTTNADKDRFNRRDVDFVFGNKYVETIRRESGACVNPSRHVCSQEMKYILGEILDQYDYEK
jgi:hypothetical protein